MSLKIQQSGGEKNIVCHVRGFIVSKNLELTAIELNHREAPLLKLSAALWVIQEKLILNLWWAKGDLLLPMESRNSLRFDLAVKPPQGWNGTLYLSSLNWDQPSSIGKGFYLVLDFDR